MGKYEVTQTQHEAVMAGNSDGLNATPSRLSNNPNRPVEQVSWDDIQVFLPRLNQSDSTNIPAGWTMYCPPKQNGNIPAERVPPPLILGEIRAAQRMQIMPLMGTGQVFSKLLMLAHTAPMHGAFMTCMEMFGNGLQTGTVHTTAMR